MTLMRYYVFSSCVSGLFQPRPVALCRLTLIETILSAGSVLHGPIIFEFLSVSNVPVSDSLLALPF